jgi:hypothetical protein
MNAIYGPPAECNIQGRAGCNTRLHAACTRVQIDLEMVDSLFPSVQPFCEHFELHFSFLLSSGSTFEWG